MFSQKQRRESLKNFSQNTYDLVIVGGGINGAGIARDAVSRGMKVALLEANDFAEGTSSRSSKLIHGGIRYLENLEFKLVFEALSERSILFEMAPHLVHPLRFVIPIYKSSRVGYAKMAMGMWLYDILAAFETPELHEGLNAQDTQAMIPGLGEDGLVGSFCYSDAYMDDDRLVIETMRAAFESGADIVNHCKVSSANWQGDELQSLNYTDKLTGESGVIKGRTFVSAVGPWTDIFGKEIVADWHDKLRPTKGIHITFSQKRFPVDKAVVMAVEERIIFVIPRLDMVIVGTTDTDFTGNPSDVKVTADDVSYLLAALAKYFPNESLSSSDIIASYAGVRPLVKDDATSEGKTSREHQFFNQGKNLLFVAGGKYTTYRKIAEEAVDKVLPMLPFEKRAVLGRSNTKSPLNPEVTIEKMDRLHYRSESLSQRFMVPQKLVELAIDRHGEEALEVFSYFHDSKSIDPECRYWVAEAAFAILNTCCLRLQDFFWRRTHLFLAYPDHGRQFLPAIADCFQKHYGWSDSEKAKACDDLQKEIDLQLGWKKVISSSGSLAPELSC